MTVELELTNSSPDGTGDLDFVCYTVTIKMQHDLSNTFNYCCSTCESYIDNFIVMKCSQFVLNGSVVLNRSVEISTLL